MKVSAGAAAAVADMRAPQTSSGLDARNAMPLVRWLLEPGKRLAPEVRAAMLGEVDASPIGVFISAFNFISINGLDAAFVPGQLFRGALVANIAISLVRVIACWRLARPRPVLARARWTSLYALGTMLWCLTQGCTGGLVLVLGPPALQVLAGASLLGIIGAMIARNYAVPRFAAGIMIFLYIPFLLGGLVSSDHWLALCTVFAPSYVIAYVVTIKRFFEAAVAKLESRQESQYQARHDPLTGTLNRFGLMSALGDCATAEPSLGLFYLDLDGFKAVNDRYGHAAGDTLLIMVADRLRMVSRPADRVARLGGDEFVIVVPGIGPAAAELFAARIIEAVARDVYIIGPGIAAEVGVSVGFACAMADSHSLTNLLSRADKALYIAKSKGKGVWHHG